MAEYAVTLAIQKLDSMQEVDFAKNIRDDVRFIIDKFKSIQVLLKDADKRSETDERVKAWVTEIRHAAFEVEDLIEEYVFQHHKQQPPVQEHGICRSIRRIKKFFNLPLMRCGRRSLGERIQNIKVEIQNISKMKERYNFAVTQDTTLVATAHTESLRDIESLRQQGDDIYNDLPGYVFEHEPLSLHESWELFHKVAFRSNGADNKFVDKHLSDVIREFLWMCQGQALAIVSMAGFLSDKETIEWDTIFRDIESLRQQGKDGICTTFSVIYNDLPCHLKPCLLYLCLFPKDYVIDCSRLLCLWAAEGFSIPRFNEAMTKEEVAKRYLDELIARRFIQVQDIDLCGRVRTCRSRIHDVFHEVILSKASEQDFAQFSSDMEPDNHSIRRLSIANENEDKNIFPKDKRLLHQIQSFFAYGKSSLFNSGTISLFLGGGVKLMKVLDLEGVHLKEFPGEILTNLYFLRYLGINAEKFSNPSSLGGLVNLETLVLKGHLLFQLPDEIIHLKYLRNIFGDLLLLPKGIGRMTTLEKLNLVVGYDGIDKELGKLTQLRSLCMVCVMKEGKSFALDSIKEMIHLRSLYLRLSNLKDNVKYNVLDVQDFIFPPPLQSLTLVGAMNDDPRQIFSLENLTQLKLSYSRARGYDFFKSLQRLHKLVELVLEMDAIDVYELYFWMGSFSKLITLELHGLSKLKSIEIQEGAMPCIQKIRFINCPLVEHVPVGIEHLTTLKRIGLANMASNLEDELRSRHWKAGHSPTVMSFADEFEMDSSIVSSFVDELDTAD